MDVVRDGHLEVAGEDVDGEAEEEPAEEDLQDEGVLGVHGEESCLGREQKGLCHQGALHKGGIKGVGVTRGRSSEQSFKSLISRRLSRV